jgi:hypothetical protein
MVALLTILILAYLLSSAADRRLSNSSLNQTIADQLARSASDIIIGDLKQEIANGSYSTTNTVGPSGATSTISFPNLSAANNYTYSGMLPMTNSAASATIPNLVRISVRNDPIAAPGVASRASAASSATASINNRSVTPKRWNAHFLIPLATATGTSVSSTAPDSTPSASVNFTVPDWVYVTNEEGPTVEQTNSPNKDSSGKTVTTTGRYAYAIYDEGGLLDVNVAGQPSSLSSTGTFTAGQASNKSSLALIDLTNLLDSGGNQLITAAAENALVGWRNYASLQSYPTLANAGPDLLSGQFPSGFTLTGTNAIDYFYNFGRGSSYAYLKANNLATASNNLTDQQFITRQQLIAMQYALQQTVGFSPSALQYLTTFSRGLDQPSYAPNASRPITGNYVTAGVTDPAMYSGNNPNGTVPATVYANTAAGNDNLINPSFLTVRCTSTVAGGRNDGSDLTAGDPLVKKRFALNRLAWITYEGPLSDGSHVGTAASASDVNANNLDLQKIAGYLHDYYGLSYAFLSKGTAANIYNYFGLSWVIDKRTYGNSLYGTVSQYKWLYNHSNSNSTGPFASYTASGGIISRLQTLASQTTPREPDFFELLKASIVAGSKGRTATIQANTTTKEVGGTTITTGSPDDFQSKLDSSLEFQTIQIGANIIEQSRLDGYPVQILYNDGSITATKEFAGTENLPYFYGIRTGVVQGAAPTLKNMPIPKSDGSYQYTAASPAPSPLPTLTSSGYSVAMAFPIIWNPHDENCPRCATYPTATGIHSAGDPLVDSSGNALFPTSFRIVADSIDPDDIAPTPTGSYSTFQLSAGCSINTGTDSTGTITVGKVSLVNADTLSGSASFVAGGPFTAVSQWIALNAKFYLSAESTALNFYLDEDPNSSANYAALTAQYFFREPTFLIAPNVPYGSNLGAGGSTNCLNPTATSSYPPTTIFPSLRSSTYMDTTGTAYGMTSGSGALLTTDNANAGTTTTTNNGSLNLNPMLGFYLGVFPGAYYWDTGSTPKETYQAYSSGTLVANFKLPCPLTPSLASVPVTYRMQYQAPSAAGGGWMTYDAKYVNSIGYTGINLTNYNNWTYVSGNALGNRSYCEGYDPRTSRFSMPFNVMNGPGTSPPGVFSSLGSEPYGYTSTGTATTAGKGWTISPANTATFGWLGGANASTIQDINSRVSSPTGTVVKSNEIMTMRPDIALGFYSAFETTGSAGVDTQFPLALGWTLNNANHAVYPGLLEINNPNYTPTASGTVVTCQSTASVPNSRGGSAIDSSFLPNTNGTLSQYYADCDGVVRRAAGAYFTDGTGSVSTTAAPGVYPGLPLATAYTVQNASGNNVAQQQVQSRPIILHRPYRSVAELGYVFSGTPFKNLDFFTPESGDCPLLDVFCIDDSDNVNGLVAGKVNLNTRQIPVLQAIIAGAYKDEEKNYQGYYQPSSKITMLPTITGGASNTEANLIATLLLKRTSGTGGSGPAWGPLEFVSDLVGRYVGPQGSYTGTTNSTSGQPYDGFSSDLNATTAFQWTGDSTILRNSNAQIQRFREAPIRALSAVGQTRVWNLMIDVIAQKGRFPSTASTLDNFYVTGEQRYWVHVAIDRFTGQVIDKQVEVVQQ